MARYADAFARAMEEAAGHVRGGDLDRASEAFRRALRYRPNEWVALAHLGACERFAGRYEQAERALRQALLVRPDDPGTLNELSLVASGRGRRDDAIAFLARATQAAPAFLQGWCNLGKLLYVAAVEAGGEANAASLRARAIAAFDRILALDPAQAEFRFLRDALAGTRVDAPPEGYVAEFFDRFAANFDAKVAGRLRYNAPAVAAELLETWLAQRTGLRVLDIGCGTGLSGAIVKANAAKLVGVDLSAGMIERARSLDIYDELVQADAVDFLERSEAGSFDLLLALDVLIYVGALERIVPAMARAVAPRGRVVLSVEALDAGDFTLRPTGRYAHAASYVEAATVEAGLGIVEERSFVVREEAGRPVEARMYVLEKR